MKQYTLPHQIIQHYSPFKSNAQKSIIQDGENTFVIDPQYQYLSIIGQGSYGVVFAAKDIVKAFKQRLFTKRTLRELRLQRQFSHKQILDKLYKSQWKQIYQQSFDNRNNQIRNKQAFSYINYQGVQNIFIQFMWFILIQNQKIFLINRNCDLKICDFGLARALNPQIQVLKQNSISSQNQNFIFFMYKKDGIGHLNYFYNVENIIKAQICGLWVVYLAEMLRKKILLLRVSSKIDQNQSLLHLDLQINEFYKWPQNLPYRLVSIKCKSKEENIFQNYFLKLFEFDLSKRITADQELRHHYLSKYHIPEDEPIAIPVRYLDFEFEEYNLTIEQWKGFIYEEILLYHYPEFYKDYELNIKKGYSIMKHIFNNDNAKQLDQILDENDDTQQNQQLK
ncbi:unnamed protein product [Paramecium sonneborni]|uniref:Protein kinase domain-containing protein n=1 Tax=Paramecium sonneborni TaxID=65129 RepID=A0A8S1LK99_9CILI|nr:unnamed protein product [Paramecium sonneborni]